MKPGHLSYTLFRVTEDKIAELFAAMRDESEMRITVHGHPFRGWIYDIRIQRDPFQGPVVTVEFETAELNDD